MEYDNLNKVIDGLLTKDGEIGRLRKEITDPTDVQSKAYQFQELMAMMHGDGGHYLQEHGPVKAAEDATAKWYRMLRRVEKLESDILRAHRSLSMVAMEMLK